MTTPPRPLERRRYRDRVDCCFSTGRALLLSVTSACNQGCIHCLRSAAPARAEALDLDRLLPALGSTVKELDVDRVVISGGEPTLVPNLLDLISAIAGLGVRPSLCTNAVRVDADLADQLTRSGLSSATVGFDGSGEDYRWFRGGRRDGHEKALCGMRHMVAAGISVTANVSLHDRLIGQAANLAQDLCGLGLSSVSVTSPMMQGRLPLNAEAFSRITHRRAEDFADQLAELMDCPVSLRVPRCNKSLCPSGKSVFAMNALGERSGCPDIGAENVADSNARLPAAQY